LGLEGRAHQSLASDFETISLLGTLMARQPVASSSLPGRTTYLPAITAARWVHRFKLGPYQAVVGTECQSQGTISYTHVLYLFEGADRRPLLAVAAEHADDTGEDGSRCLALFYQGTHYNFGFSHEWADLEQFTAEAIAIAAERLGVTDLTQLD
jgi:hypothetical protein